jgi:D-amino-acid oxidase
MLSMNLWDDSPTSDDIWWAPHVDDFRTLSADIECPLQATNKRTPATEPKTVHGAAYNAMTINVPQYLLYLQEKGRLLGATVIKARLPVDTGLSNALQAAADLALTHNRGKIDAFVNATGLGARKLCGDDGMYPIRGQTVLVKGESHATITRVGEGYRAYCIPRPGSNTTILGGTKDIGAWEETPDPKVTEQILKHNSWHCPELLTGENGGFEVVSVQCGLRPARKGGARVECEMLGKWIVVHAYGHAGAGYQNSVGCARDVVGLVEKSVRGGTGSAKL